MAGESPDKSDKKQASGKAQGVSDPRLAVLRGEPAETTAEAENAARGAAEAAGASGDAGAPEKPETATDGASGADGASRDTESAESAGADGAADDADGPDGATGDRLRAAVAAWVAGKDDETESPDATAADAVGGAGTDGDATAAADGGSAKKPAKAAGDISAAAGGVKESAAGAETAAGADAGTGSGARSGADGAGAGSGDAAGAGDADDAGAEGDGPAGEAKAVGDATEDKGGEARPKGGEAKAADRTVSGAEGSDAKGGTASGAGAAGGGASAAAGEGTPDEDDDVDRPTAVFTAKGKKSGAAEEPVDNATRVFTIAKSEGKRKPEKKAEPEGEAAPGAQGESAADPKGTAGADAEGETGGKSAAYGDSKAGADAEDKADGKGMADAKDKTDAEGKADAASKVDGKGGAGSGKKGADLVDPPTTAFRLAPPDGAESSKGAKDAKGADGKTSGTEGAELGSEGEKEQGEKKQGDKEQKGAKADPRSAGKAGGGERDAERTSQFVALKSDDTGAAGRSLGKTAAKSGEKDAGATAVPGAASRPAADGPGTEKSGGSKPDAAAVAGAGAAAGPGPGALPEAERTRQEPLPPLDLLAQLTNTPPPPETTFRTVVRRFKIWTPLVILLAIIFVVVQSVRPLPDPALALGDSTAFTFKGGRLSMPWPGQGQSAAEVVGVGSLGTSGPQKPVPTASVAKVMTAYVILRDHPLKKGEKGESITIDAKAAADSKNKDESRVPLQEGQKFSEVQMLQMLMIPSGNNAARQLARWDSGSEEAFVKKMNAAAGKLGMTKTTYTDPSGLAKTTVSTAVDQLKLAGEVMKNDAFRAVVATENVQIDGLPERLFNNNSLLTTMPYVVRGIKTGSSTPAGGAFMWAAYRTVGGKDQLLLGVTMDQRTSSSDPNAHLKLALDNSAKIITAAREALVADTVVKKGQVVGYVDDGLGGETPVVATKDLPAVGWPGMKATFTIDGGGKTVPHEAKAGTEVGVLTVGSGDSTQRVPVALAEDLTEPTFGAKLTRIG
ncbi:D-alanyl-D-alanine carboxypeptidase [Streptomyces sp. BBFR2]|uniref:D-alanyl-D-alanine carboxypeptidase n=1 Tax=Streptomyces sp. BBFR2 TaxID=3372854 RepID=UPI0037DA0AF5